VSAQTVLVELFYNGVWNDVTADTFVAEQIKITRGQGDEISAPRPARTQLTFNNGTDKFRPSNPVSPLYGLAGRNTPLRVSVASAVRGVVEASSWAPDRSISSSPGSGTGRAWVDIDGGGILQRVNQWTEVLKSPFRQYNETITSAVGYWPAEQARGSTDLISTISGTGPAPAGNSSLVDVAFDSQYKPPSSAPLMDLGQTSTARVFYSFARNAAASPTVGWQLSWAGRYGTFGAGNRVLISWNTIDGSAWSLTVNTGTGNMGLNALSSPATGFATILAFSSSYGSYDWSQWTLFSIDAQYSAGTTTMWVNWANADNTVSGFISTTFSGVPSSLDWWLMGTSSVDGLPSGSTVGHVMGTGTSSLTGTNLFDSARRTAWTGYLNETAADRVTRLCALRNVAVTIIGTAAESWPMGAQPVDTLAGLLAECVRTEDGLLFDDRTTVGLKFRTRGNRYNQSALALTYPGDIYPTFQEVLDDLGIHNIITVNQRDGGDYTLELDSGAVSTLAPPAGVGPAEQRIDVNTADEVVDLPTLAGWWLNHGTVDLPRYTAVTVNLTDRDSTFTTAVAAVDVGDRITITGYVEYVIDLIVLGYVETVGSHYRSITFTCAPGLPYLVGVLDTDLLDSGSTVLKTGITSSGTSLTFRTSAIGDVWSTTTPYDVLIAGERLTVTSMGAASLVSGAYDQAATCTRHVNGIVKAQLANAPITDFAPARCAL
jgi:hypothetical protein